MSAGRSAAGTACSALSIIVLCFLLSIQAGCSDSSGPADNGDDTPSNKAPVAAFAYSPETGTRDTLFVFDASSSSDPDDPLEDLEVRWDFDGDDAFDTDWSAAKEASFQYPAAGTYVVTLEVRDPDAAGSSAAETLRVDYTWTTVSSSSFNDLLSVWGTSSSDVFATGGSGTVVHYTGTQWEGMTSGTFNLMYCIGGASSSQVWIGGYQGVSRFYNGSSWMNAITSTTESLHGIWVSTAGTAYAVGTNAKIMYTTGAMWYGMTPPAGMGASTLYTVWGTSDEDVWAAGDLDGLAVVIHYNDVSWSIHSRDFADPIWQLWGSSSTDIYAIASDRSLWHYDGASWSQIDDPAIGYARCVDGTGPEDVYVHSTGKVARWDGAAWQAMIFPVSRSYNDMWIAPDGKIFMVGNSGAAGIGEP